MRRFTALLCAVALVVVAASFTSVAAAKKPPSKSGSALRICEQRQGGLFVDVSPLVYACVLPSQSTPLNRRLAQRACQRRGGLFVDVSPVIYACVLPGGTLPDPFPPLPLP